MTKLLMRLFVKDNDRGAIGRLSGIVGIICNLLLVAGKMLVGILSGSVAVTADALNNLADATSSVVTFVGFKLSERPADDEHPYGQARYEYISALVVAGLILVIGFELAKSSIEKIIAPSETAMTPLLLGILLASVAVKFWMYLFNRYLGKVTDSGALLATAMDSRNDCIATTAVVAAAAIEFVSGWMLDGYIGLAVSLFILYSGVNLARETISPLLGEGAAPELRECIVDYVSQHPKVLGYHDLYVHDYGPGRRFASLHVEMSCKEDPMECHEIIDDMERECFNSHGIQLVIHYDPVVTDDPELARLHSKVDSILKAVDARLSTHDFRMVRGAGHTNLIFDVVMPYDLRKQENHIRQQIADGLSDEEMTYYTVIAFDADAFDPHK